MARATKTMPLVMGISNTTTESNAIIQWQIYLAGIKSIQTLLENMIGRLLTLSLQCQGVPGTVTFKFNEVASIEALRDSQTVSQEANNAAFMYAMGWISQDEASEMVTGTKADVPEPRVQTPEQMDLSDVPIGDRDERMILEIKKARQSITDYLNTNGHHGQLKKDK